MKMFALLVGFHLTIAAAAIVSMLLRREGWSYFVSMGSLAALSLAPVLLAVFFLRSMPYFNMHLPWAVVGVALYVISAVGAVAALVHALVHRRRAVV